MLSCNICTGRDPSWGDVQVLLKELFWPGERGKVINSKAEWALQTEGNRSPCQVNDPNWNDNTTEDRPAYQTRVQNLVEAI